MNFAFVGSLYQKKKLLCEIVLQLGVYTICLCINIHATAVS